MGRWLKIFLELSKFRLSLLVALSTGTGFILATHGLSRGIVLPVVGIFLLACGSSTLNQYQEREIDALMDRTKGRPIPSGAVRPLHALLVALSLIFSGFLILFYGSNLGALGLSILAVLWYNGVYTYLKRESAFAAIPGALVGAVPPAVGWTAGGGGLLEPQVLAIAFFFFIWQVPHSWLLLLSYPEDYEKAGLPSLTRMFTTGQLTRIVFMWILGTAATCLFLIPIFGIVNSYLMNFSLLVATLWLVWKATKLLRAQDREFSFRFAFREINIYALLVLSLLSLGTLT